MKTSAVAGCERPDRTGGTDKLSTAAAGAAVHKVERKDPRVVYQNPAR